MSATKNQGKARTRKDFVRGIGGGLLSHEPICFVSGETGLYAGEYRISKGEVIIPYYLPETPFSNDRKIRYLPSKVIINNQYYPISGQKVPKPKYEIKEYIPPKRIKPLLVSGTISLEKKVDDVSLNQALPSQLSQRSYMRPKSDSETKTKKHKGKKNNEFVRGKSGLRSH